MEKTAYKMLKGSQHFRQRLILRLSSNPEIIEDIRTEETWPGVQNHEVYFLRFLEKISDGCVVEINETGTKLKYEPVIVMGGNYLVH